MMLSPHIWVPKNRWSATHGARLERFLGVEKVNELSAAMRHWPGPPIAVAVPGGVYVTPGGDFIGAISGAAGFTSISDVLAEASAGKRRRFPIQKVGTAGVVGVCNSLIQQGSFPPAAANAAAAPGGDIPVDSTTGFHLFTNPTGGDTQHFVTGFPSASVLGNTLLLVDVLFRVNKTMNSTATEAVTGVPTRYQNTVAGSIDSAEGNFLFVQVGATVLPATAHNWTVCLYTDQGGVASTFPSFAGRSAAAVHNFDMIAQQWFAPFETGDRGIQKLTQMQCSALVATGVINFVIAHPIAWMPCPSANTIWVSDGIGTAFNVERIFDDAALGFIEYMKPATTATTYGGEFITVAG